MSPYDTIRSNRARTPRYRVTGLSLQVAVVPSGQYTVDETKQIDCCCQQQQQQQQQQRQVLVLVLGWLVGWCCCCCCCCCCCVFCCSCSCVVVCCGSVLPGGWVQTDDKSLNHPTPSRPILLDSALNESKHVEPLGIVRSTSMIHPNPLQPDRLLRLRLHLFKVFCSAGRGYQGASTDLDRLVRHAGLLDLV